MTHIVLFPAVGAIAGGGAAVVVVIILLIFVILLVLVILKKKSGESLTANVEFTVGVFAASIATLFDNCIVALDNTMIIPFCNNFTVHRRQH